MQRCTSSIQIVAFKKKDPKTEHENSTRSTYLLLCSKREVFKNRCGFVFSLLSVEETQILQSDCDRRVVFHTSQPFDVFLVFSWISLFVLFPVLGYLPDDTVLESGWTKLVFMRLREDLFVEILGLLN